MEPEGLLTQDDDIMALLHQDNDDLDVDPSNYSLDPSENGEDGIIMQHMDIREPLATLRDLLVQRLGIDLSNYSFWLQDAQMVGKNFISSCLIELDFYNCIFCSLKVIKIWWTSVCRAKALCRLTFS